MNRRTEQIINAILLSGIVIGFAFLLFTYVPNYIYNLEQERFTEIKASLKYDMELSESLLEELKDMSNVKIIHNWDLYSTGFYTAYLIEQGKKAGVFEHRIGFSSELPQSYPNVTMFFDFSYRENKIP